jgi:hypothetical protein
MVDGMSRDIERMVRSQAASHPSSTAVRISAVTSTPAA